MDIVLFGMQGSGKGTLGKMIADKYGYKIFETGGELRKLSHENSPLAQKVKAIIEAGHLVPNEVVMEIVENFIKQLHPGEKILFDGIPRSIPQAESFDALMQKDNRDFKSILIEIPQEVSIKRLSSRRICEKCKSVYPAFYEKESCQKCGGKLITRSDDNPESIKTRLQAYFNETIPVIEHYQKKGKMLSMNGDQSMDNAAKDMQILIEKEIQNL